MVDEDAKRRGALGFALYSARRNESATFVYTLLTRRGRLLHHISFAFLAEAPALEWALEYVVGLLRRQVRRKRDQTPRRRPHQPKGKRQTAKAAARKTVAVKVAVKKVVEVVAVVVRANP